MTIQDPNSPPQISIQDIIALTTFLLIRIPWTIFKTALYRFTGTPNRPPLLKDLTRSLIRESFDQVPPAIHNTLPNKTESKTLLSIRYSPLNTHLFHKIQRPKFTGYWICRGLLPTTPPPMDPKQADIVIYHLRGSGYALGHPGDTLPGLLFLAEVLEKKGIRDEEKEKKDKDKGEGYPRPGSMILLSPWIDLSLSSPLIPMLEKRDFLSRAFLQRTGTELLHSDTRLVSLFGDFTSRSTERGSWELILPSRTWVSAGADEIFVDDIERFVNCAREDGVEVELRVEPGKCHSWQSAEAFLAARWFLDMSIKCEGEELMPGLVAVAEVIAGFG
ncbi:hypothetical protein BDV40DRAFT_302843 [Aspergillus tamarii]|uniref:Alpha/Beta hydrolase protein n=1 Tax=Aspergillus tamarii TaxID=41984 RepID=A0A5N6UMG7_ASPTM|nr:hypothetical protein BDV40DRAFT_302843 [Aspergillus tamarii]